MINKKIYLDNKRFEYVVGKPINYKGINIYPVKVEDYFELSGSIDILMLHPKELATGKKELRMDYLTFLFSRPDIISDVLELDKIIKELPKNLNLTPINLIQQKLLTIFKLVFKEVKTISIEMVGEHLEIILDNKIFISPEMFEDIRSYILAMNDIPIDLEERDYYYRQELDKAKAFIDSKKPKQSDICEQIHSFHAWLGRDYDYIMKLTIKQFNENLKAYNKMITALRFTMPLISGDVKNIPGIFDANERPEYYDGVEVKGNMNSIAEKLNAVK